MSILKKIGDYLAGAGGFPAVTSDQDMVILHYSEDGDWRNSPICYCVKNNRPFTLVNGPQGWCSLLFWKRVEDALRLSQFEAQTSLAMQIAGMSSSRKVFEPGLSIIPKDALLKTTRYALWGKHILRVSLKPGTPHRIHLNDGRTSPPATGVIWKCKTTPQWLAKVLPLEDEAVAEAEKVAPGITDFSDMQTNPIWGQF